MKFINKYNTIGDYNDDVNRPTHNTVSYIKNEGRIIYTPIPSHIEFADPEVIRVLRDLVGLAFEGNKAKLIDIEGVNSFDGNFYENEVITQFPELQYFAGLTDLMEAFTECSNLTTVGDIPEGVTDLSFTFCGCSNLTTAPAIPSSVTDLNETFGSCSSLTTAPVIPEGVTNLNNTFDFCSSLTKAPVIPSSVTVLSGTFRDCLNIDGIYIIEIVTPPSYDNSLSNVQAIYVPDASVDAYKSASGWTEFADKIYPMSDKATIIN